MEPWMLLKLLSIIAGIVGVYYFKRKNEIELRENRFRNAEFKEAHKDDKITILYLRDFAMDGLKYVTKKVYGSKIQYLTSNLETSLSLKVGSFGRFIAVGLPSPQGDIGAERLKIAETAWKETVLTLMKESAMIIFRPSLSVGLAWEFRQIVENNYLSKTVICFKTRHDGTSTSYKLFRDVAKDVILMPKYNFFRDYLYFSEEKECFKVSDLEDVPLYKVLEREAQKLRIHQQDKPLDISSVRFYSILVLFLVIMIACVLLIKNYSS